MRNELGSLLAAAVVVADTRALTARCMPANGRAWLGEQELWMLCSTVPAALACKTPVLGLKEHTALDLEDGLSF